jgi:hypothetical protein
LEGAGLTDGGSSGGVTIELSADGVLLTFTNSGGIVMQVFVKGGTNGQNVYDYSSMGGVADDDGLKAPLNADESQPAISHVDFCVIEMESSPTATPTASPTATPTASPTATPTGTPAQTPNPTPTPAATPTPPDTAVGPTAHAPPASMAGVVLLVLVIGSAAGALLLARPMRPEAER